MKDEEKKAKIAKFCVKYKVNFFVLALALFMFNGILYELAAILPTKTYLLHMEIDNQIPFIPEFCFFYTLFYLCPVVFLTALSFYDKKKVVTLVMAGVISIVLAFIVFIFYNVQMVRPEAEVAGYWFFDGSITNIHEFFMALCHFQYNVDPTAKNAIPSLHAMFGGLIFMSGCPLSRHENKSPIVLRIFAMIFGLGIAASTFFVKQHYFIDAVLGFGLAVVMYFVCKFFFNKFIDKHSENRTIKLLTDNSYEG